MAAAPQDNLWSLDFYRIRKKSLTIGNKYWIEDGNGRIMGFSKQKLFKLKEDIRIYSDEQMTSELFQIKQTQIVDMWGKFSVVDTHSGTELGYFKRKALKSGLIKDEWEIYNPMDQMVGRLAEGTGRGLARKYVPVVRKLIPEKLMLEYMGRQVTEIKQHFKIIGDIWDIDCRNVGPDMDRRVLLSAILLMGMIERSRK